MPSIFTLSGPGAPRRRRPSKRGDISALPKPTRAQIVQALGPFATKAQIDRHLKQWGRASSGLGAARDRAVCPRVPAKNVQWTKIPHGTRILDCGNLFVAKLKTGAAVVNWSSFDAGQAQAWLASRATRQK